jgi:hypothetical protein
MLEDKGDTQKKHFLPLLTSDRLLSSLMLWAERAVRIM